MDILEKIRKHFDVLCNQIGERHNGSAGEKAAVEYLSEELATSGLKVEKEYFEVPGWNYGKYYLKNMDSGKNLDCFPCYCSNSIDIKGKPELLSEADLENLETMNLSGKICFLNIASGIGVGNKNHLAEMIESRGAAALIVLSNYIDTPNSKVIRNAELEKLAVMCVSGRAGLELVNDINSEYHLCIEAEKFDYRCANIIGVMNPEAEGKKIIVAAHYDTAPGTVGACDNASGTVVLLLLAGILKKKDISERIDFIVFGSEEFGSRMGSSVYVEEHKNELDNIRFMCNLDDLACPLAGQKASIYGPEPFCASVEKSLKNYGILKEPEYLPNGDNKFFYEAGVPNVSIITKAQSYIQIHSPDDNMTKVNAETAMNAVKAVANLVENIIREKVL